MATDTQAGQRSDGSGTTSDAQGRAQEAAGQVQERAQAAAGQAHAKVREQVEQRSSQLGVQAHRQASDLRSVSQALRDQGKHRPAEVVERVASYTEQAGSYLRDRDADSILSDAEDLGRRKPGAVAVGALAVGLIASRFLKASSSRRYSARQTSQHQRAGTDSTLTASPAPSPVTSGAPPAPQPGL